MDSRSARWVPAVVVSSACFLAACASTASGATVIEARTSSASATSSTTETSASVAPTAPDSTPPTAPPISAASVPDTVVSPTAAPSSAPAETVPTTNLTATISFNAGSGKASRPYDDIVRAELDDIVSFWANEFPVVSGSAYRVPANGVFPGYPGRSDIPNCGPSPVDYATMLKGNAFYCPQGDYLAYDDDQLFPAVFDKLGAVGLGIILAHELGHSVQTDAGVPSDTPTIILEQQADCYAGTWAAHLQQEQNPTVPFGEGDIKNALLALLSFKDPIGATASAPGAHGSGFDRVGAFEDGFSNGAKKCFIYVRNMPSVLELPVDRSFFLNNGNAPLDDANNPALPDPNNTQAPSGIYGLLITDLPRFWQQQLSTEQVTFDAPKLVGYDAAGPFPSCSVTVDFAKSASVYCPSSNTIAVNSTIATRFYNEFGDFSIGYIVGDAYSEAVQRALGSQLTGAKRALLDDCLTGVYTRDTIPGASNAPNQVTIQAGDLDEAVEAAVELGDATTAQNELGTGFEKVGAFRTGVLTGMSACKVIG
ncbi:MAG: hypothetical protein JWN62_2572 [Acidimicrobiales bacterium]|nr:hypothetical protein [Acidimicrobiales bacterium]